jgi:hypothetical protein
VHIVDDDDTDVVMVADEEWHADTLAVTERLGLSETETVPDNVPETEALDDTE